ncbi:hypothetical protein RhiirA5_493950 [Rhizophagus irregularis]|uniref:Uncharacterized protein n=1 Tax=Rhizophagus irregularis TaxID=588596 RepID=A0A2N0QAW5_9GLOM|nr:hypothetical protein RhiirA5_493950 [Rhizophagus irregularis]GBC45579.1 hypothetical protein RIR_jg16223.t1 [Rhizophagus irregularis DAOM 181602=DAOM 197198]UZO21074.1 hypothetical protein OCT59_013478 [Rhizophagus irregularis]CAB4481062.1 unnamed protein product [Rhizophagus irregularis]CAB4481064.1 unnamed protein product [Rhizophagus irregularis]
MRSSLMIFIIIILINAVNSLSVSFEAIKEHHYADIYCIAKYDKCTTHCKGLSEPYLSPCVRDCMEFCELNAINNKKTT